MPTELFVADTSFDSLNQFGHYYGRILRPNLNYEPALIDQAPTRRRDMWAWFIGGGIIGALAVMFYLAVEFWR